MVKASCFSFGWGKKKWKKWESKKECKVTATPNPITLPETTSVVSEFSREKRNPFIFDILAGGSEPSVAPRSSSAPTSSKGKDFTWKQTLGDYRKEKKREEVINQSPWSSSSRTLHSLSLKSLLPFKPNMGAMPENGSKTNKTANDQSASGLPVGTDAVTEWLRAQEYTPKSVEPRKSMAISVSSPHPRTQIDDSGLFGIFDDVCSVKSSDTNVALAPLSREVSLHQSVRAEVHSEDIVDAPHREAPATTESAESRPRERPITAGEDASRRTRSGRGVHHSISPGNGTPGEVCEGTSSGSEDSDSTSSTMGADVTCYLTRECYMSREMSGDTTAAHACSPLTHAQPRSGERPRSHTRFMSREISGDTTAAHACSPLTLPWQRGQDPPPRTQSFSPLTHTPRKLPQLSPLPWEAQLASWNDPDLFTCNDPDWIRIPVPDDLISSPPEQTGSTWGRTGSAPKRFTAVQVSSPPRAPTGRLFRPIAVAEHINPLVTADIGVSSLASTPRSSPSPCGPRPRAPAGGRFRSFNLAAAEFRTASPEPELECGSASRHPLRAGSPHESWMYSPKARRNGQGATKGHHNEIVVKAAPAPQWYLDGGLGSYSP